MSKKKSIQKPTWKEKIDPSIAEHIKSVIEMILCLDEPNKEDSEELIESVTDCNIKSFKPFYEGNQYISLFVDILTPLKSIDVSDIENNKAKQEILAAELGQRMTPELMLYCTFQTLNLISTLIDGKSLMALYEEARAGSEKSLFTLLKYDKTLFDHEWLKELIFKKLLLGNFYFFEQLGDAIKSEPPIGRHKQGKLKLIVFMFWKEAFSKLTYQEQMEFLEWLGLEVPFSYDTYKKIITREIKPKFIKNQ
jgi:hypothetical protein